MTFFSRLSLDRIVFGLLLALSLFYFSQAKIWQSKAVIDWDVTLYYAYLPGLFIEGDLRFEDLPEAWSERHFFLNENAEGQRYLKMTGGLALLYSPFFALGHLYASLSDGYPADGFSAPYRFALLLSSLCYAFLGLHFLRLLLRRFFRPGAVALSLAALLIGTNLAYYSFVEPMTHAYNFFLVAFFLWAYFRYRQKAHWHWALSLGLSLGLLSLIRPVDFLIVLFPLLHLWQKPPEHWGTVARHAILAAGAALLIWLPQMAYWHYSTGHWLVYSYNEEGFFWLEPKILAGLFSFRKGWWLYSPVLLLMLPGFFALYRQHKALFWPSLLSLIAVLWVTFSWWCWWYGGGFGARPLIDFLALAAFPLSAGWQWLWQAGPLRKGLALLFLAASLHYSYTLQRQYYWGLIHWDSMSAELYWRQIYRWSPAENYESLLDPPDYEAALKGER